MADDISIPQIQPHYIRWMIGSDMKAVLDIDDCCYSESWSARELRACMASRAIIGLTVEDRGTLLGFVIYELAGRSIRIVRMGVDPRERRCGVATSMLDRLKSKLSSQRRLVLTVDVDGHSIFAQKCLAKNGFTAEPLPNDVIRFTYKQG